MERLFRVRRLEGPLQILIGDHLRDVAKARAAAMPIYDRSMRGADANEVGAMGEVVALHYLNPLPIEVLDVGQIGHDLEVNGRRVEVKTKERTVAPQPHYECTVPAYVSDVQRPDRYLFVSLQAEQGWTGIDRFRCGWILGTMDREAFVDQAHYVTSQDLDTSNDWRPSIPCWQIPVSALDRPVVCEEC